MSLPNWILTERHRLSYHIIARHYRRSLRRIGVSVLERPLPTSARERAAAARECAGQVVFHSTIGPLFAPIDGCVNVALPHHEWSRYPSGWVERLNEFDAVWTASRFVQRVLRDSGVSIAVSFVPPALELDPVPRKSTWTARGPFRFFACGEAHFRKGFHLLIAGFLEAFPQPGEASLTIKTGTSGAWTSPRRDVRIVARRLSRASLLSMYRAHDAYVSASLGEGLDLPAAEAVLAGLPVVTHRWSGHADLLTARGYVDMRYRLVDQVFASQPSYYASGQQCALSRPADIARALRSAAATTATARSEMAGAAYAHLLGVYGAEAASVRLRRAWRDLGRSA